MLATVFLNTGMTVTVMFVIGCGFIIEISLNVHVFHCDLCPKLSSYLLALKILYLNIDWGVSWSVGEGCHCILLTIITFGHSWSIYKSNTSFVFIGRETLKLLGSWEVLSKSKYNIGSVFKVLVCYTRKF